MKKILLIFGTVFTLYLMVSTTSAIPILQSQHISEECSTMISSYFSNKQNIAKTKCIIPLIFFLFFLQSIPNIILMIIDVIIKWIIFI